MPAALILTAGIILDRYADIPIGLSLLIAASFLVAWGISRASRSRGLPLLYLAGALATVGAAYHHAQQTIFPADDIGELIEPEPQLAALRGTLDEEPIVVWQPEHEGLQSFSRSNPTVTVLRVTARKHGDDWQPASGRVRMSVAGTLRTLPGDDGLALSNAAADSFVAPQSTMHVGDEVEAVGKLVAAKGPANPGEFDYAAHLRDQRIRGLFLVQKTSDAVILRSQGQSLWRVLALVKGRGQRTLDRELPATQSGIASALLLGEGSTMTSDDWQKYIRTGVIHVLAISGQHLVILAGFLWFMLRIVRVPRRHGAWIVALVLIAYALLAGARPPVLRAAVMVTVFCGSIILRRPALTANAFALAWILIAVLNPADIFDTGCQLSFLAVAILYWGTAWLTRQPDELERVIDASRPAWERGLRGLGRMVALSYAVTALIWLAAAPLVAARYHLVSPVAIVIGPPMVLLTTIALLSGFMLLFAAVTVWPLVPVFATVTDWSLRGCDLLVSVTDRLPLHIYVGDVPEWWLWGFYLGLFALLMLQPLRWYWRRMALTGVAWLCVGLIAAAARPTPKELCVTFLAVGHGGCTVIETPDGRTLLYDAGTLAGPDVTRRQIAPYLWSRGIRRIDEVFLSHADLDHFNGLAGLAERFSIGQVTCTPTFSKKETPGVTVTLAALERRRIPLRTVEAGNHLSAGNLSIDVLHPPGEMRTGSENERSLVLLLHHAEHRILLTGDLEKAGLDRVLALPSPHPDVLMAPHHGNRFANIPPLAEWAKARAVISSQGPPRSRVEEPYTEHDAVFLTTWAHGAITIRSGTQRLVVETFASREQFRLR
jgi:competence protein ComEC